MARFSWPQFLRDNRIPYVTSGPNTARGNVNIRCPFCGENDPSEHMGLSPSGVWGCLRNAGHRGKAPARLVSQLLGCSPEEARRLVGGAEAVAPTYDEYAESVAALNATAGIFSAKTGPLRMPKEFKPLTSASPFSAAFRQYLLERGYRAAQIEWLTHEYDLRYATTGLYAYRIVIPIYDRYKALLSWTARGIKADAVPRYRTLRMKPSEDDPNGPVAKLAANDTILGLPVLYGAKDPRVLVIVEGPFDALKLTAYGHTFGVYATCLFGLNVYPGQVGELLGIARRFDRVCLLIDEDAEFQRLRIVEQLMPLRVDVLRMPENSDDPGAFTGAQAVAFCLGLLR